MRLMDIQWPLINGKPDLDYALLDFGSVYTNTRYVQTNPFGNNTPVDVVAEVWFNGKWSSLDMVFYGSGVHGMKANYVEGEGIVLQTAVFRLASASAYGGGGHNYAGATFPNPTSCRVHVWRVVA